MKLQSNYDLKSIRTRLNDVQREFNVIGKRIENLGLSKDDYDTVAGILTKRYQEVTKLISEGKEVPGVTDILTKQREDRAAKNQERKDKKIARVAELKGKGTLSADEQDELTRLEKQVAAWSEDDNEGEEAPAASNGAPAANKEAFV